MKIIINDKLYLIYTEANRDVALQIEAYLKENFTVNSGQQPQNTVASAVIVISDDAVKDPDWQAEVRALNGVRLIPVGQTVNADYSDPNVIPRSVEEINFIRITSGYLDHIYDSIMLDEEFYQIRNTVLVSMQPYMTSNHSKSFLMTEYGEVKKYLNVIEKKEQTGKDESLYKQLLQMKEYLEASKKYARKLLLAKIRRRILFTLSGIVVAVTIIAAVYLTQILHRASVETDLLTKERTAKDAGDSFAMLSDALTNPLISGNVRAHIFQEIQNMIDINWYSQPVALNYKYELSDPQLLSDQSRYFSTYTDHHTFLIWDTMMCEIESESNLPEDMKASYIDSHRVFYVSNDNKIYISQGDSWVSSDYMYPFTGNCPISIRSDGEHAVFFDDQNIFFFEATDSSIRLLSFSTMHTMYTKNYKIYDVELYEDTYCVLLTADGELSFHLVPGNNENTRIARLSVQMDENCTSDVYKNEAIFADVEGNIMLFRQADNEVYTTGLQLPSPKLLSFVNDSTIVWYDEQLGSHLYDVDQEIDLGEVFTGLGEITQLQASEHALLAYADGAYRTMDITHMLPLTEIDKSKVIATYNTISDHGSGMVDYAEIVPDHLIKFGMTVNQKHFDLLLDSGGYALPAGVTDNPGSQKAVFYGKEPFTCEGSPTCIGIIDQGYGLVIGAQDGRFGEFLFRDDGSTLPVSSYRVPSHSAIVAIYEMEDHYYLEDAAGNYWYTRLGYKGSEQTTSQQLVEQMNEKYARTVSADVYRIISKSLKEDLKLQEVPGSDGKEWE